jgi:ATP-dependent Lhr-like helicase
MVELASAVLKYKILWIKIWGITATINLEEALEVLIPDTKRQKVVAKEQKKMIFSPPEVEIYQGRTFSGKLVEVVPVILKSKSTLVFTNTRSQVKCGTSSIEAYPDFAGQIALIIVLLKPFTTVGRRKS